MHVVVMKVELHLPHATSLKAKRSIVTSVVKTLDRRSGVAAAEVGALDKWQRAELGITVVSGNYTRATQVADDVERRLWSLADAEVSDFTRSYWEGD